MKKELRRQIKQDELRTGFARVAALVAAHRDGVRLGIGVALVLGLGLAVLFYLQGQRTREAELAFQEAFGIFHAPVSAEIPEGADAPAGVVFPSAEEKYKAAAAAFDGIDRRYGSHALAVRSRYYAALCRIELGEHAEAEKTLAELASSDGAGRLEPALARLALAGAYRRRGEVDKAVETYRALVNDAASPLPRDYALRGLAATLEEAERAVEAAAAYRELSEEFPDSALAPEARRRAEHLRTAS